MDQDSSENNNSICFVANFYKTYFFHKIALQLEQNGINVFWIVPKESQIDFLSTYYPKERILSINRSCIKNKGIPVNDYKINELIFGDRVLRHEYRNGQRFLINIQQPIYNFIVENNIQTILGEVTWAHELLIHRIVSVQTELNCKYFSMHTVRIPNGRFAFFKDEKQSMILENTEKQTNEISQTITVEKPAYLKGNDAILKRNMSIKGRVNRLKRLFSGENIEKTDPNVITKGFFRWWIPVREEYNRECYKWIRKKEFSEIIETPYVLFGFHKQPEASVDVCGRYFENQVDNVINLWRQLPTGWNLVVKEHTNAIGDRSYKFYKDLKKYPGIILANEKIDSHLLIKKCKLVATNTGTMALEAALLGIPAITFSKVFFNKHNYCKCANWTILENYTNIHVLIDEITSQSSNSEDYTSYIQNNTYEGVVGDVFSNPTVTDPDNVSKIAKAILKVVE